MGISQNYLLNYNVMFIFIILTYIVGLAFYCKHRSKRQSILSQQSHFVSDKGKYENYLRFSVKAKRFFYLDTPLYIILWFSLWTIFAGQIQIRSVVVENNISVISGLGIAFFAVCLLLFILYLVFYVRKNTKIQSFHSVFTAETVGPNESKPSYFYVIFFIERIILATLLANVFFFDYLNCVISATSLIIVVFLIFLKPYKFKRP